MGKDDHCAVYGFNNNRRYPETQVVCPHVGLLGFYPPPLFIEVKARILRYWMDFTDTQPSQAVKKGHVSILLIPREEFILTFVTTRTRKGY